MFTLISQFINDWLELTFLLGLAAAAAVKFVSILPSYIPAGAAAGARSER